MYQFTFTGTSTTSVSAFVGSATGTFYGAVLSSNRLYLDGASYVEFVGASLIPTSGDWTVTLWAQQLSLQTGAYTELFSQGAAGNAIYLGQDSSTRNIRCGDGWVVTSPAIQFPSDLALHHYTLTSSSSGSYAKLYIDGVLKASKTGALPAPSGGTSTRFGRQYGGNFEYFNGYLDDFRVFNYALNDADVAKLAATGGTYVDQTKRTN